LRFFKKIQGESGETACWQSRRLQAAASLLNVAVNNPYPLDH